MFPNFSDEQSPFGDVLESMRLYENTQSISSALMTLALHYKRENMSSCANDLIECAIKVRSCGNVMFSIVSDSIESLSDGKK